jgi:DNA-binding beta-propeller fold protein YncE
MMAGKWIAALLVLAAGTMQAEAQSSPAYRITKTIPIGAPDRWDYVVLDPTGTKAYVAHGSDLTAIDLKAGKVTGTINVGGATHGAVAIPALGKGYTDDGKAGVAVAFDLKTLKELKRIKVEPDADGIVYDPVSGHVLVITGDSGKVGVIDPKSDKLLAEIDGGGPLEFGVLGGNGKFYVDGEDKNEIVRMDLGKNAADAHWPLTGCKTPHGLAIDRAHMRLFASCGNKMMDVVDANTGKVLASLPIGAGTDFAEFDARNGVAFSSNRDGTLSMVTEKGGQFVALPPVTTMQGARTMALDHANGRIYTIAADTKVNTAVPENDRQRYQTVPGTAKLLVLEPVH